MCPCNCAEINIKDAIIFVVFFFYFIVELWPTDYCFVFVLFYKCAIIASITSLKFDCI